MIASVLAALARLISGAGIRWVGCSPAPRQRIYFANHTSHFDFLVLWAALPGEVRRLTRPVAAQDYWRAGRLRRYMATRIFHAVLIERRHLTGPNDALDVMLDALGDRHSLILFPEGTRGAGAEPGPFRSGLYNLGVRRPDVELVPAYIANLNRVLPKGAFLPVPLCSSVSFGPPLRVGEGEGRDDFLRRARQAVLDLRPI